jgi:hypothetical protein
VIAAAPEFMLNAALWYATLGLPVFPVHWLIDGHCSCGGGPKCRPGKHPRTPNGFKDAITDAEVIRRWWKRWPHANIGLRTGKPSGMVAWDIDPRHCGDKTLAKIIDLHGPLPETVVAQTGGGGQHIVFAHPGWYVKCRESLLPGIDIRADGGYIVVEPSVHENGPSYAWKHRPRDVPLAHMPQWMLDLLDNSTLPDSCDEPARGVTEMTENTEKTEGTEFTETTNGSLSPLPSVISVVSVSSVLSVIDVAQGDAEAIVQAIEATAPTGTGQRHRAVFAFARHVKGILSIADAKVAWFRPILKLWHHWAYPNIGTKPFEDTWADFIHGFPNVNFPKGEGPMAELLVRADKSSLPTCAKDYDMPQTIRLIKLCRELQRAAKDGPFFLSCRTAGELLGIDHNSAAKLLRVLLTDNVISLDRAHTRTQAARYRYAAPD